MFLFLSKLAPLFVYPLGLACMLLASSYFFRKRKRLLSTLISAAFILLWVASNGYVSGWLARSLEWRHLPPAQYPPADVIVVLGGGTAPASYPRAGVEVSGAGDRVIHAAWLYKQGQAPLILATGGTLPWSLRGSSPAADMKSLLVFMGVPEEDILLEEASANTYENALFSRQILDELKAGRILLVTSAMHMPRSVALFEKQGLEVVPAPTDFNIVVPETGRQFTEIWPNYLFGLLPQASDLNLTTLVLKEYFGILVYGLRGWL